MPITDRDRVRRMVGDRFPPGGDEGDVFFSNEEIDDLIETAGGDLNLAAYSGWLAKMAEFAKLVDTDISGAQRKFSQMYKNAANMADHYEGLIENASAAVVGRVVGRVVNLRERRTRSPVMTGSGTYRTELGDSEARQIMHNSHPELVEVDETYPEPGKEATS